MTYIVDNKLSIAEWECALKEADRMAKESNGHLFETIIKTRCMFCGRSPRAKGKCGSWFHTFIKRLEYVLMNKKY